MNVIASVDYINNPYQTGLWLGGVFSPQGFVAATRQYVAQKNTWPLEQLQLNLEIGKDKPEANCFIFNGLTLYGAGVDQQGRLILSEKTSTPLPTSRFSWILDDPKKNSIYDDKGQAKDVIKVLIPVYLNPSFKNLLFSIYLPVYSSLPNEMWTQRAVSLCVWSN